MYGGVACVIDVCHYSILLHVCYILPHFPDFWHSPPYIFNIFMKVFYSIYFSTCGCSTHPILLQAK